MRIHACLSSLTTLTTLCAAALCAMAGPAQATTTLTGWAQLDAATFADGPTSGQFAFRNAASPAHDPPWFNLQPVQGFSAVLPGANGSWQVLVDNGFGSYANSADALLRMYAVRADFRTASGGSGTIGAADWATGAALPGFSAASRITLSDPNVLLGQRIQADYRRYYNNAANPLVDSAIRDGRLLTGADFDPEGVQRDRSGNLWVGDEFGPYLVKTSATGEVLRREIALPGVFAPENPAVRNGSVSANLGSSRGFEGLAMDTSGQRLYTLLEGTVAGDPARTLRINAFDLASESFVSGQQWLYGLDPAGTNIGEMTAISDHEFLVIERNGGTGTSGSPFKKIFKVDLNLADASGRLLKTEVVDLMQIADPDDLNGDGQTRFSFPYVTIESIHVVDSQHLLIINDNNFPGGGGRGLASDNTEFLMLSLSQPVPEPAQGLLLLAGLAGLGLRLRRRG